MEYVSDVWNWNDIFTIILYTAFMIFRSIYIAEGSQSKKNLDELETLFFRNLNSQN